MFAEWEMFWADWLAQSGPMVINSAVFARVRGVTWNIDRDYQWSTLKQQAQNGRYIRIPNWKQPLWKFVYRWGYVKDNPNDIVPGNTFTDLRTLWGKLLPLQGQANDFFYQPDDSAVINQLLVNDGNGNAEIIHSIGGYPESVQALDTNSLIVTFDDVLQSSPTIAPPSTVPPYLGYVIQGVPAPTTVVKASFNYFYRCMMSTDVHAYSQIMANLWDFKTLDFEQTRL